MKIKFISLSICILLLLPVIFACDVKSLNPGSDSTIENETITDGEMNIPDETALDEEDNINNEEVPEVQSDGEESFYDITAKDILRYIKDGNYQELSEIMMATNAEAYKFIQDMTVDSYEIIEERDENSYSKYFKIKFNVSKSDNQYFPAGESYWDLIVTGGMEIVTLFKPSDPKNLEQLNHYTEDREYSFCYNFSHHLGIFETATDFNTVIHIFYDDWGGIVHDILHFYGATSPDRTTAPLSADYIDDYMLKTTGITGIDYTVEGRFNPEDISEICLAHGGSWLFWNPVGKNYDENAKIYTVIIDYFADTSLLVVAKTIEYKFELNDDGTYKMLSTDAVYDSGYNVAGGSI